MDVLPLEYVYKVIDEAYDIPSFQVIVFSGGEPTIFLDHLKLGIKHASELGFIVRMVTNAWWAKNYEEAKVFLEELTSLGLKELNISYDDFHLEYLKKFGGEQNVINAVKAALDTDLKVIIAITKLPNSKITSSYIRNMLSKENIKSVEFIEDFIAPLGRARNLRRHLKIKSDNISMGCRDIGTSIAIYPNGEIVACCGHIFSSEALDILTIGNVKRDSLVDAVKKMQRNVLYWWIYSKGPYEILKFLNIDEEIYHKCEACNLLYKYREKLKSIASKKEKIFKALIEGRL